MSIAESGKPSPSSPGTVKPSTSGKLDPTKWHCDKCDKTSYESEYRGWQAIGVILRAKTSTEVPKRVYACPYGDGFHLTSRDSWP